MASSIERSAVYEQLYPPRRSAGESVRYDSSTVDRRYAQMEGARGSVSVQRVTKRRNDKARRWRRLEIPGSGCRGDVQRVVTSDRFSRWRYGGTVFQAIRERCGDWIVWTAVCDD